MKFKIADFSSRAQKSPKTAQNTGSFIAICSIFEEVLCEFTY